MRYYPHGFAVDLGLRLACAWEPIGDEPRLVASTQLHPRRFERPRWIEANYSVPRAILFDWREREIIH